MSQEQTSTEQMMSLITTSADSMVHWSDAKKSEFSKLFDARARASAYICVKTAAYILDSARNRHMVNRSKSMPSETGDFIRTLVDAKNHISYEFTVGGRTTSDLDEVAKKAAQVAIRKLPSVTKALEIIAPSVLRAINSRDEIFATMEKEVAKLDTIPHHINLSDPEFQDLTVRQFRAECIKLVKRRDVIAKNIDSLNDKFTDLDKEISRALFKGIPGISEAVEDLVKYYQDRAKSLINLSRRAEEKVKFGDSAAASSMLEQFEKDEQTVNDSVKKDFDTALEKLKLIAKKGKLPKEMKEITARLEKAEEVRALKEADLG